MSHVWQNWSKFDSIDFIFELLTLRPTLWLTKMGKFIDYQDTDDAYEKIFVLFWDFFFF